MSERQVEFLHHLILLLISLLAGIAISLSAWALMGVVALKSSVAKLPEAFPPEWFKKEYEHDREDRIVKERELDRKLEQNQQLILKHMANEKDDSPK